MAYVSKEIVRHFGLLRILIEHPPLGRSGSQKKGPLWKQVSLGSLNFCATLRGHQRSVIRLFSFSLMECGVQGKLHATFCVKNTPGASHAYQAPTHTSLYKTAATHQNQSDSPASSDQAEIQESSSEDELSDAAAAN